VPAAGSAVAQVSMTQPVINGLPKVGYILAVAVEPTPPTAYLSYQWFRGTTAVTTRSDYSSYTVKAADAGADLVCKVWALADGVEVIKYSNHVQVQGAISVSAVTLQGVARVGYRQVAYFSYSPVDATVTYQWYRGTSLISGATGNIYNLVAADGGKDLVLKVTVTKDGYDPVVKYSNHVLIDPGLQVSQPVIEQTMDAYPGIMPLGVTVEVTPATAIIQYQWFVNGLAVSGATGTEYIATGPADVVCKVTVTDGDYGQVVKYSNHVLVPGDVVRY
jgi:hypothetical protein